MKVFSKVINDETKQLDCIVCGDTPVLEGYSELEREIGYDGNWYLQGYAPEKPAKETAQEKIAELKAELAKSDYVVLKITEALDEAEKTDLLEKYADVLKSRREARVEINKLAKEYGV